MKHIIIVAIALAVLIGIGLLFSNDTAEAPTPEASNETQKEEIEMSGIHIMPDGSIMAPSGEILTNAKINAEGNIVLPDGRVVQPMADFRE